MKDLPKLRKGVLTLKEAYGQAMAVTAPLGSVVSTSTAAVAYAGNGVVFATLLGLAGSILWVATLSSYARGSRAPEGITPTARSPPGTSTLPSWNP
jgi:hypothetical protein